MRGQDQPLRVVPRSENLHRVIGHLGRRRDLGQEPAVRAAEAQLAVGVSIELVALLVDGAMVSEEPFYQRAKVDQLLGQAKPGDVLRNLLVEASNSEPAWTGLQDSIRRLFGFQLVPPDATGAHILAE